MTDRELAALIWLGVGLLACLLSRDIRRALAQVVRAFLQAPILISLAATGATIAGLLALPAHVGLWSPALAKEAAIWFVGSGLVLLMNMSDVMDRDHFFRSGLRRALRMTVFVGVFVNLAVFSLPVELILFPLLLLLVLMSAVSDGDEELRAAKAAVDWLLAILGWALVLNVVLALATDWDGVIRPHTWQSLVLPFWLTCGALPMIYGLGLFAAYQRAFAHLNQAIAMRPSRIRAKVAVIVTFGLKARKLSLFGPNEATGLASSHTLGEALSAARRCS